MRAIATTNSAGGVYAAAKDEAKCGFKTLELGKNAIIIAVRWRKK